MNKMQQTRSAPNLSFDPLFAMAEASELERTCQEWGITRRLTACLATKSRDDLSAALWRLKGLGEGDEIIELLGSVQGLIEHYRQLGQIYECVQARLFISAHDVFGISLNETDPQPTLSAEG